MRVHIFFSSVSAHSTPTVQRGFMIQLVSLRSFFSKNENKTIVYDKLVTTGYEIPSLDWLYKNVDKILENISQNERWNIFYTIANCTEEKRIFQELGAIAFDIDGVDSNLWEKYLDALCHITETKPDVWNAVSSGNGLHFICSLDSAQSKEFMKREKIHYNALCKKLNEEMEQLSLAGKADPTIFEPRRILRMPGTINRKPDKPEKQCYMLKVATSNHNLIPSKISGIPKVDEDSQISKKQMRKYTRTDNEAVMTGCAFLKHATENPHSLDEPQWYAALSITGRLDGDGHAISHAISKGHPGYSEEGTDRKIKQALEASGPRTCDSISSLWNGCRDCPNYQKVESPIRIVGPNFVETELTGFHNVTVNSKGEPKYTPNYEDLIKHMARQTDFKSLGDSRHVYVWDQNRYVEMKAASIEAFARQKFDPTPKMEVLREFRQRVEIANIVPTEWWENSLRRKMNFLNGYLDIDTMEFKTHDKTIAFRNVLPYEYNPAAKAPHFDKMLDMVTGNDTELRWVLLEYMGYCLSNDDCWPQKALVLTGEGSNGKSTFLDALMSVAGDENYATVNMAKVDEHYNLAMLDKKLFNISEETSPKALADNQTFKNLVTGGKIIVRLPREAPYQISNSAKLILTCNELPNSPDNTHGFYRRLLIVPFSQRIEKGTPGYDPHLIRKIRQELPGVLNMALEGYKRLHANIGFTQSNRMQEALEEYQVENDTVLYWVQEYLTIHTNGGFDSHSIPTRTLYAAYRDCMKSMSRIPVHEQKFLKQLRRVRGEIWGEHPLEERFVRKTLDINGEKMKLWVLQGVSMATVN